MAAITYTHPEKGEMVYKDWKRNWWLLSLRWPWMPLIGIALYFVTGNQLAVLTPLAIGFVLVPIFDVFFGEDKSNPPEEVVPQLAEDQYYRWLTFLAIPAHFVVLGVVIWFAGTQPLDPLIFIGFAVVAGMAGGLCLNTAHEIGHKNTKLDKLLSRIVLAVPAYGHFCIEHNNGHHRDVSTPEDPASSRMGESIYRFMLREIPGAAKRGWAAETERLERQGLKFWTVQNHVLQSYALSLLIQGGAVAIFGWIMIPFFIIHNFFAWFQLTSANYIEHYGLLREKQENGRYERCKPHHSWNANHIFSNIILFQLERHSDHHANASRPYQSLRSFDNLPELPSGYFGMYFAAYYPWLWYKIMDKRLLAIPHINGDFSKINMDPKYAEKLKNKYASFEPQLAR
jgi:alkane 1-monooxygenase